MRRQNTHLKNQQKTRCDASLFSLRTHHQASAVGQFLRRRLPAVRHAKRDVVALVAVRLEIGGIGSKRRHCGGKRGSDSRCEDCTAVSGGRGAAENVFEEKSPGGFSFESGYLSVGSGGDYGAMKQSTGDLAYGYGGHSELYDKIVERFASFEGELGSSYYNEGDV